MKHNKLNEMELNYINDALDRYTTFMKEETVKAEAKAQESGRHYIFHESFWDSVTRDLRIKLKIKK